MTFDGSNSALNAVKEIERMVERRVSGYLQKFIGESAMQTVQSGVERWKQIVFNRDTNIDSTRKALVEM